MMRAKKSSTASESLSELLLLLLPLLSDGGTEGVEGGLPTGSNSYEVRRPAEREGEKEAAEGGTSHIQRKRVQRRSIDE